MRRIPRILCYENLVMKMPSPGKENSRLAPGEMSWKQSFHLAYRCHVNGPIAAGLQRFVNVIYTCEDTE
jgi:hypothetical protein